jgi:tetratricopeptide (TPR) repeat protein
VLARALQFRASILARMGRLPEASSALERSIDMARRRHESETLMWALSLFTQLPWLAGEAANLEGAAEAVQIAVDSGNVTGLVLALRALALATLAGGRPDDAITICGRALDEGRRTRSGLFEEAPVLAVLARSRLAAGDPTGALAAADEAVATARAQQARVTEAQVLLARGHVRRAAGVEPDEIRNDLGDALAVVAETGARMFEPFVREELARLDGDRASLAGAQELFSSVGATGHARRLREELAG